MLTYELDVKRQMEDKSSKIDGGLRERRETMYSPQIEPMLVRKLYLLKMSYTSIGINKPMTKIVEEALEEYIPKATNQILSSGGSILKPDELGLKE